MNNIQKDLRLLPNYFKKIAFGFILLFILLAILTKYQILPFDKDIIKAITKTGLLISLLLLALTKDKIEDELTLRIRLRAFTFSFFVGVVNVILEPYMNLLLKGSFLSTKGTDQLIFSMIFFYFIMFFLLKRSSRGN